MTAQVVQLVLSLAAVLALVAAVRLMRLGTSPVLTEPDEARRAAALVADGFEEADVALDRDGMAALLRNGHGRVLLLRVHGAHIAGRVLDVPASARLEGDLLVVDPADRRFGPVRLRVGEPEYWKMLVNGV